MERVLQELKSSGQTVAANTGIFGLALARATLPHAWCVWRITGLADNQ